MLLLFYLTGASRHFTFSHFVSFLNESQKKDRWKIIILSHDDDLSFYKSLLDTTTIQHEEFKFHPDNNYLAKVNFAVHYAKDHHYPYMMKCDNDLFFRGRTLDYMIEQLPLLEDDNHVTLGPLLSSGIPCIEYFMNDFLSSHERAILQQKFLETQFTDIWGATYTYLNEFTQKSTSWDGAAFFNAVKHQAHHYKGIHPIRVNVDAIEYLNSCIIAHKSIFFDDRELSIIKDNTSPYLCNSVFCIKTSTYSTIINDKSLYVDDFDEVPVNKYTWNRNGTHLFVKNGFGIHMHYNTIPGNVEREYNFCSKFF